MPDLLFCLHTCDMIHVCIGLCSSTSFLVYKFACRNLMCGQLSEDVWRGIYGHMMDLSDLHNHVFTCDVHLPHMSRETQIGVGSVESNGNIYFWWRLLVRM